MVYPYPLEFLDDPPDSVTVDTSVKWLQTQHLIYERFSISQGIYKGKCTFMFALIGTFGPVTYWIRSTPSVHDRDLVLHSKI